MGEVLTAMGAEEDGAVIGYMCATDWECEIGIASGGNRVFPSLEDALERLGCAKGCGVVEVEVRFRRVAAGGTGPIAPAAPADLREERDDG